MLVALAACSPPPDRVADARAAQGASVRALAQAQGLEAPVRQVYLRAFKRERELEVWGANGGQMKLLRTYPVAGLSGALGPKRREGDGQVPEGLYVVDRFNPKSRFLLSLGLDYPNASDRVRSDPERPGSDIFVHGGTASIGCLAMTDPAIQQIYLLALDADGPVRVDVFPFRFASGWDQDADPAHVEFWREIAPFHAEFERTRKVPSFSVANDGRYLR
jgi:murein L,D-transpeptidase YafK